MFEKIEQQHNHPLTNEKIVTLINVAKEYRLVIMIPFILFDTFNHYTTGRSYKQPHVRTCYVHKRSNELQQRAADTLGEKFGDLLASA